MPKGPTGRGHSAGGQKKREDVFQLPMFSTHGGFLTFTMEPKKDIVFLGISQGFPTGIGEFFH